MSTEKKLLLWKRNAMRKTHVKTRRGNLALGFVALKAIEKLLQMEKQLFYIKIQSRGRRSSGTSTHHAVSLFAFPFDVETEKPVWNRFILALKLNR